MIEFHWFILGLATRYDDRSAASTTPVVKEGDVPKPKKFFKSRDPPDTPPVTYSSKTDQNYGSASKKQRHNSYSSPERDIKATNTKKFFSSKNNCSTEKTVLGSNVNYVKRGETKPPIVLRICRGLYTFQVFILRKRKL